MNNINLKFYEVDEDWLPFVEIRFKGMDSKIYSALMLMDSGSNINSLAEEMRILIGKSDWVADLSEVVNVANETKGVPCAKFGFEMDGQPFQEEFAFQGQHLMQIDDMMFVGVLGNSFMQKYHLAIDYSNLTVHTSNMTLDNLKNKNCSFIIPMDYGLKFYNVPILKIRGKVRDAVILVDTGYDNFFSLSQKALDECGHSYKLTGNIHPVEGPNGSVEANECVLDFMLIDNRGNEVDKHAHQAKIDVLPNSITITEEGECDDEGTPLSPIDGMIGSTFMARQKWIIDFGVKALYKYESQEAVVSDVVE